jgi:Lon-like ATP-dependent protease
MLPRVREGKSKTPKTKKRSRRSRKKPGGDYLKAGSTSQVEIPERIIDQVIGQDEAVEVIRTAAEQKRNVLLIGDPGTGKSMLGRAMAELLPSEELEDIVVFPNPDDENNPRVRVFPAGEGKRLTNSYKEKAKKDSELKNMIVLVVIIIIVAVAVIQGAFLPGIIAAVLVLILAQSIRRKEALVPKLLVDSEGKSSAPFVDATGAHAGALLGDVRHDPFQSGGLGTPPHERVECGMIHRANKGVLFVDEIGTLSPKSQQELLTSMQERKFQITGQSELSSGAMVRTEPVPCEYVLVAAGNVETIRHMHPALRSRIRGYGYEVYMENTMEISDENTNKLIRFMAQEITNDKKIPHFNKSAIAEIVTEGKRRSSRKEHYTLMLRDLGGLIRAAGDIALKLGAKETDSKHVSMARKLSRTLEEQIADRYIENKKEYEVVRVSGEKVGQVNGLAVIGNSGIITAIAAEATKSLSKQGGSIIATGKLGKIAREAVQNVSAIVKKYAQKDLSQYDLHIQFLQAYAGVEGDSASISVATAVISAIEGIPVDQKVAMTGSLSVRGEVMPVGGVGAKIEAAIEAGIERAIVPAANLGDITLEKSKINKIEIIPVRTIDEVLDHALTGDKKLGFLEKIKNYIPDFSIDMKKSTPSSG